jgi:hypothetical protein
MVEIGDKVKFKPAFLRMSHDKAASPNVAPVIGTVVYIDPKHRWYRVEYSVSPYYGPLHECINFNGGNFDAEN